MARGFLRAILHGLPEVTAKAAVSLDGAIATAAGESQWITGEPARAHGHELRARHDAILVGIGTVLEDNPRLTCRARSALEGSDPVPVVLDSDLRIPKDAALFSSSKRAVVFCRKGAPERDLPCEVVRIDDDERGVDLRAVLQALVTRDLHRVLVEGGGAIHRSFMDARLLDTLHLYLAGLVIPGGKPWVAGAPVERLQDALRLGRPRTTALGDDILLSYDLSAQHVCGEA
ncbi:MAG TPA: RibD family protein [Sneathiellales bacterium]|nr:RibD family protein [Sneathiellales bacterium]